jgi:hypothetical protein
MKKPIKQLVTRAWRTYRGGKMLAGASDVVFVLEINDADGY